MKPSKTDRAYWLAVMCRICDPVLRGLQNRTLRQNMPIEQIEGCERHHHMHLEAFGRTIMGIAPWLDADTLCGEEEALRAEYAALCREAMDAATDPASPDCMAFASVNGDCQPLVDAAFLAGGLLRAPNALWAKLSPRVQKNLTACLLCSREIKPGMENNHLLFAALVEAALYKMGVPVAWERVEYALARHHAWYKGDGVYGDGMHLHCDYYNSFVIHPAMLALYDVFMDTGIASAYLTETLAAKTRARAQRCAQILEMQIAADGTFPAIGRSVIYRMGAFHLLSLLAWHEDTANASPPAALRCALTAVLRRCAEAPGMFDENGWLRIGLAGHQPALGERYISTGSLYACMFMFPALGLSPSAEFWSGAAADWHSVRIWSGENMTADHSYTEI